MKEKNNQFRNLDSFMKEVAEEKITAPSKLAKDTYELILKENKKDRERTFKIDTSLLFGSAVMINLLMCLVTILGGGFLLKANILTMIILGFCVSAANFALAFGIFMFREQIMKRIKSII